MLIVFTLLPGSTRRRDHIGFVHGQHPYIAPSAGAIAGMDLIDDLLQLRVPLEFLIIKQSFQLLFHLSFVPFSAFFMRFRALQLLFFLAASVYTDEIRCLAENFHVWMDKISSRDPSSGKTIMSRT